MSMYLQTTINNTQKYRKRIDAWRGLNRTDGARDGEMTLIRNLSTDDYPTIKTRKPRSVIPGYEGKVVTDVFNANGHLVVVADGTLFYDGEEMLIVGNGKKQFALVNTQLVIWPDKIVLDLNDGHASQMEAYLIGTAHIDEDGGNITYIPGGALAHGTITYAEIYGVSSSGYIWEYTDLTWAEGAGFSWSNRWRGMAVNLDIGSRFIPIESGGTYVPRTGLINMEPDDTTGSIYGVVLDREMRWENYNLDVYNTISYAIYDAAGGGAVLTETFAPGETINLEGFIIKANNKKNVPIDNIEGGVISFPEGTLISSAYYFDVETALLPKKTKLEWTHESGSQTVVTTLGSVNLHRVIRPGEQIYLTGGAINGGVIDTSTCRAYVYDPETRTTEELEFSTSASGTTETIQCNIYLPSMENENVVLRREVPDLAFVCEHENRLWGVSNEETETIFNTQTQEYNEVKSRVIFGSALGQPKRMYEYTGTATDSYAVAVSGNGDFTAICSYNGALLAWKEDLLCRLTGSFPAEYYLRTYRYEGVASGSEFSLQTINEVLYYLSPAGVMAFSGTAPQLIGEKLGLKKLAHGVSGRDRTHYYLCAEHEDGSWLNAVYDFVHSMWSAEEEERVLSMDRFGDHCYAAIGGGLFKLEDASATEEITWEAELACIREDTFNHKRYTAVSVEVEVAADATFSLQYKDELDQDWITAQTAWELVPYERVRRYVIDTKRSSRLYIRLSGTGYIKLFALEREYSQEAER